MSPTAVRVMRLVKKLNPTPEQVAVAVRWAARVHQIAGQVSTVLSMIWPSLPKGKP